MGGPDAGVAVSLEFKADGAAVGPARAHPLGLLAGAGQALHVVADLVGDHIGPRRIASGPVFGLQLLPERQVQIDLVIGRTIERPHGGLPGPAAGAGRLIVDHHRGRRAIGLASGLEDRFPNVIDIGGDHIDEAGGVVGRSPALAFLLLDLLAAAADHRQGRRRIDAEHEIAHQRQDHPARADAADPGGAHAAPVLDIAALAAVLPTHAGS